MTRSELFAFLTTCTYCAHVQDLNQHFGTAWQEPMRSLGDLGIVHWSANQRYFYAR